MNNNFIVVADGSRARFFQLEEPALPEVEPGPNLMEVNDLVNTEKEAHGNEIWSDTKSGRNRAPTGGAHGYDDHRDSHAEELERRFARDIAAEAVRLSEKAGSREILLVAQKRALGFLRNEIDSLVKRGIRVKELAKDLSKLKPHEIHEHLAREKLIPKRRPPLL